jgi:hypothetical protein
MPARRNEAAEVTVPRRFRIDMKILWVIEPAEADDFGLGKLVAAEGENLIDGDVFKPAGHFGWLMDRPPL